MIFDFFHVLLLFNLKERRFLISSLYVSKDKIILNFKFCGGFEPTTPHRTYHRLNIAGIRHVVEGSVSGHIRCRFIHLQEQNGNFKL